MSEASRSAASARVAAASRHVRARATARMTASRSGPASTGLVRKSIRTVLHRQHRVGHVRLGAEEDHRDVRRLTLDGREQIERAGASEPQVEQHAVRLLPIEPLQQGHRGVHHLDVDRRCPENSRQRRRDRTIVVDHPYPWSQHAHGPPPGPARMRHPLGIVIQRPSVQPLGSARPLARQASRLRRRVSGREVGRLLPERPVAAAHSGELPRRKRLVHAQPRSRDGRGFSSGSRRLPTAMAKLIAAAPARYSAASSASSSGAAP